MKCQISIPDQKYHNDILHPCVRFFEDGFYGHKWWLIVSPWYDRDDSIENPILFYGEEEKDGTPPLKWYFHSVIKDTPAFGYNSDPTIDLAQNEMLLAWREVDTPYMIDLGFKSGILYKYLFTDGKFSDEHLLIGEKRDKILSDLSPIILRDNNSLNLYTVFHVKCKNLIRRAFYKGLRKIGLIRYSSQTLYILKRTFNNEGDIVSEKKLPILFSKKHLPWHFDLVYYRNKMYLLLYCEYENSIYLGEFEDDKIEVNSCPITKGLEIKDTYKPTGVVVNDRLWLYYTDKTNPFDSKLNELHRAEIDLSGFLDSMK